jgi:hypothetical protein
MSDTDGFTEGTVDRCPTSKRGARAFRWPALLYPLLSLELIQICRCGCNATRWRRELGKVKKDLIRLPQRGILVRGWRCSAAPFRVAPAPETERLTE